MPSISSLSAQWRALLWLLSGNFFLQKIEANNWGSRFVPTCFQETKPTLLVGSLRRSELDPDGARGSKKLQSEFPGGPFRILTKWKQKVAQPPW
jgi:hypothetical protein